MKTDLAIDLDFYPLNIWELKRYRFFMVLGAMVELVKVIMPHLIAGTKGDLPENILENRKRVAACFGMPIKSLMLLDQVHGGHVIVVDEVTPDLKADAMVTKKKTFCLVFKQLIVFPFCFIAHLGLLAQFMVDGKVCQEISLSTQ